VTPLDARLDPGTTTLRVSSDDLELRGELRDPRQLALSLLDHLTPDDIAEHLRAHPERWAAVHEGVTHDAQRSQIEDAYVAELQAAGDSGHPALVAVAQAKIRRARALAAL